jgi:hypothetical protein
LRKDSFSNGDIVGLITDSLYEDGSGVGKSGRGGGGDSSGGGGELGGNTESGGGGESGGNTESGGGGGTILSFAANEE